MGLRQDTRARDLRSTFATLLIYERRNVVEVADQLGSSAEVVLKAYAGIWAECGIEDRKPATQAILDARAKLAVKERSKTRGTVRKPQSRRPDSNRGPLHYE